MRRSSDCAVDVSLDLWVDYVYVDGARYVARVSNEQLPNARRIRGVSLLPDQFLYLREDHLGITELAFGRPEKDAVSSLGSKNGLFWRTVPIYSKKLELSSDVSVQLRSRRVIFF